MVKAWTVYRCFQLQQLLLRGLSRILMCIKCWLWGIERQQGHRYFGLTHFMRHPTALIKIGQAAVFRSAPSSNSIGLNRSCRLSASAGAKLIIGDHCGFSGVVIAADLSVTIGDRVMCGANVTITDSDRHPLDATLRAQGHGGSSKAVIIDNDVWLGMNVVVLKGVHIGSGAVIAANSVVCNDIPANAVAGGNPASVIKWITT